MYEHGSVSTALGGTVARMRSSRDVESFLMRMSRPFEVVDEQGAVTFVLRMSGVPVAVKVDPPLVITRVDIGSIPARVGNNREALFEHLLHLNATSLVHASYGIDGDGLVLGASMELENLDYNEFDAVFIDIDLALAQHLPQIRQLAAAT
jgi:hypothetical protein